jgi:hypothetical protein
MSNLIEHAKREMKLIGLDQKDADYGGALYKASLELIKTFSKQGHSGGSAASVIEIFDRLARFKPLSPITDCPTEWTDVSAMSGKPLWQNIRCSSCFSEDGGKTWKDIDHIPDTPKN